NAARVPRIIQNEGDRLRNFSLVTLQSGKVSDASIVWVNEAFKIVSETVLYRAQSVAESIA
ncbi:MAG: TIGR04168 family protein, partial [Candidatus Parcubacteria bacterium]|nr:TIGR04168 family protein [Leptolyngbyaceae cyanobacterium LF-bin-113]